MSEANTIYLLEYAEDNGDTVQTSRTLYASIGGLLNGIRKLIRSLQADVCSDEDHLCDDEEPPSYVKKLLYYHHESIKNAPIPTMEYVESVLNNKQRLNGLIIKIGHDLGGSSGFACEISVRKDILNP